MSDNKGVKKNLADYFKDTPKKESDGNNVTIALKVSKTTAKILCVALGISFEDRVSEKQIAVMALRNQLHTANGKVLPMLEALTEEEVKQFAKDLSY